eukprot:gene6279-2745_t
MYNHTRARAAAAIQYRRESPSAAILWHLLRLLSAHEPALVDIIYRNCNPYLAFFECGLTTRPPPLRINKQCDPTSPHQHKVDFDDKSGGNDHRNVPTHRAAVLWCHDPRDPNFVSSTTMAHTTPRDACVFTRGSSKTGHVAAAMLGRAACRHLFAPCYPDEFPEGGTVFDGDDGVIPAMCTKLFQRLQLETVAQIPVVVRGWARVRVRVQVRQIFSIESRAIVNAAAFNANLAQAFEVGDRAINNAILQPTRLALPCDVTLEH